MEKVFKDNKKLDVAYKTSDGKFFFRESDAKNYAKGKELKNKKVTKVTRSAEKKESKKTNVDSAEELAQKTKELQELELVSKNYNKMKSLANYFNLSVEGKKAEDYIKALEDYKQKITD